ncbi:UNVERIFIED_CONTAM: protein ABSCISIC ACID-INSENSITIVE 5 [Sesamum radiatum]|uniref:Protein ABSCISIC ACID-INSENSITIVE 5 n=1 Tax=Sesamum radiatum TaxID=300843 RepID=A0AAW2KRE5_SESRA
MVANDSEIISQGNVESQLESSQQQPENQTVQSLGRQSSIYSLTLDEFQHTLCESGKNFGSMNMDEFLNSIWTAEESQAQGHTNPLPLPQAVPCLPSKKVVPAGGVNVATYQALPQSGVGAYSQQPSAVSYGGRIGNGSGGFGQVQGLGMGSPACPVSTDGLCMNQVDGGNQYGADTGGSRGGRKRIIDGPVEKVVERRQRRMIKNRESAARSRARKQAYTVELEAELNQLKEENAHLKQALEDRKRKSILMVLGCMWLALMLTILSFRRRAEVERFRLVNYLLELYRLKYIGLCLMYSSEVDSYVDLRPTYVLYSSKVTEGEHLHLSLSYLDPLNMDGITHQMVRVAEEAVATESAGGDRWCSHFTRCSGTSEWPKDQLP